MILSEKQLRKKGILKKIEFRLDKKSMEEMGQRIKKWNEEYNRAWRKAAENYAKNPYRLDNHIQNGINC